MCSPFFLSTIQNTANFLKGWKTGMKKQTTSTLCLVSKVQAFQEKSILEDLRTPKAIELLKDGETDFKIVASTAAPILEATNYLIDVLNQMAKKPAFSISTAASKAHAIHIETKPTFEGLQEDGYAIFTDNGDIYICGICDGGTANGVYRFMEDCLQCMFVRHDYDYIPQTDTVYLEELHIVNNPDFPWRHQHQYEADRTSWHKRLLCNGAKDTAWGSTCHTAFDYVNPKIYFKSHPEYFSLRYGKRVPEQLCLSNENIYPIISESLNRMIAENPTAQYWDFSIMDNLHYCQCKSCRKLYRQYGKSGSILRIVNQLAKEHPDKIISTLAYTYNEQPPKNLEIEPNVNISLAPIKSGQKYSFPLKGNHKARKTYRLISDWSRHVQKLYIWDYVVNFRHVLLPYPNFDVQKDNLEFYKAHNVKFIFHQGMRENCCELACLRTYVMAKQLFDIDTDINNLLAKYLVVTYGKAAPYVAEYLETANCFMKEKAFDLDLYDEPYMHRFDYLSKTAIQKYLNCIKKAFGAEAENETILSRLEEIKIGILYAKFTEISLDKEGKEQAFWEFKHLVKKHGVTNYNEWNDPSLDSLLQNGFKDRKFF